MRRRSGLALAVAACLTASAGLSAQYLTLRDPKVPRTADGKPNLTAPAPRLPDGKPDLSGLWNAVDGRYLTNITRRAGIEPPFQPWAAALFKERHDTRDLAAGQRRMTRRPPRFHWASSQHVQAR